MGVHEPSLREMRHLLSFRLSFCFSAPTLPHGRKCFPGPCGRGLSLRDDGIVSRRHLKSLKNPRRHPGVNIVFLFYFCLLIFFIRERHQQRKTFSLTGNLALLPVSSRLEVICVKCPDIVSRHRCFCFLCISPTKDKQTNLCNSALQL